jgi:hypothetical protein
MEVCLGRYWQIGSQRGEIQHFAFFGVRESTLENPLRGSFASISSGMVFAEAQRMPLWGGKVRGLGASKAHHNALIQALRLFRLDVRLS